MAEQSVATGAVAGAAPRDEYWTGDERQSFEAWMNSTSDESITARFEQLVLKIRDTGKEHYHLKFGDCFDHKARKPLPGWGVSLKFEGHRAVGAEAAEEEGASTREGGLQDQKPAGPVEAHTCMSCDLDARVVEGVLGTAAAEGKGGPTSKDSLVWESERMRVWFDAKARPMLVVTPKR
eukprot:gene14945-21001_t